MEQKEEKVKKPEKIGYTEEYDPESGKIKKSMVKILMPFFAAYTMFYTYQSFITEGNSFTANSITFVLLLFAASLVPELIKDIAKKRMKK